MSLLGYEGFRRDRPFVAKEDIVKGFMARHEARITCALSGFDWLVLDGTLVPLTVDGWSFNCLTRADVRFGCSTS